MAPEARVEADLEELREIAEWFRQRGDDLNARFLHDVATRYEIVAGAYRTAAMDRREAKESAPDESQEGDAG